MLRRHLWNDAPIIIGIAFVFTFHVHCISVVGFLHVISFWFIITMLIHFCFSYSFWLRIPIYIWNRLIIGVILLFRQTVSCLLFYSTNSWMRNSTSYVTLTSQLLQTFRRTRHPPQGLHHTTIFRQAKWIYTSSVPKVMRMILKIYWTYMQLQFIPFKIGSLWSNTAIPRLLPLFITVEEVFTWDVVQSPRHSCPDVFSCPKMMSFEVDFELGE